MTRKKVLGDYGIDTSNVVNMNLMFYDAGINASSFSIGDITRWNVCKVKDYSSFSNLSIKKNFKEKKQEEIVS